MIFKETSNKDFPTIILLHGGGLSNWSLKEIVNKLKTRFHVVTPIIDGHGEDGEEEFVSIVDSATKLINYIDTQCNEKVFAIGGLSIGAQIVTEVLSKRENIADYAIIESALVYPIKGTTKMMIPIFKFCYGLLKKRWFAKMQAKSLCVSPDMFETYYEDSIKISRQSLINITLSNGNYNLKSSISNTKSKVLIIVGEKELGIMKKSAQRLHKAISGSELYIAPKMKHGEISLMYPEKYIELIKLLFVK
ncbi:MAG: alpha/beta hydrolase [Clostridium sp.]|nr:alpha/beta hydrolase [Clostridium sp.]